MKGKQLTAPKKRADSLIELLELQSIKYGHSPVYSLLGRGSLGELCVSNALSFSELEKQAKGLAAHLQSCQGQGSVVLLCFPFGLEFTIAFWGCIMAGVVPIPLSRPKGNDWRPILEIAFFTQANTLLTHSCLRATACDIVSLGSPLQIVELDKLKGDFSRWKRPKLQRDDLAFVQFTSGSTSSPKGVSVSHANILANLESIEHAFSCSDRDITVSWLPFYHDMGLVGHIMQPVYSGMHNYFLAPMLFMSRPSLWLQAVSQYGATISGAPNFAYDLCNQKVEEAQLRDLDFSRWRIAYCGSEPIAEVVATAFSHKLKPRGFLAEAFTPCYGLAESTLFVCSHSGLKSAHNKDKSDRYVCLGKPRFGELKIVRDQDLRECEEGEVGEIWLRSQSVVKTYYKDPERTRAVLRAHKGEGGIYLRTGDLGFLLENELYVVGRIKNLIKRRGKSFHCEDVERSLSAYLKEFPISRCVLLDTEYPSGLIVLVLESKGRLKNGACYDYEHTKFRTHVLREFGLLIDRIVEVRRGTLPLTTSGKIKRHECIEIVKGLLTNKEGKHGKGNPKHRYSAST
ncbi:MAG: fatty acyl-AMP ligase [Pseudohongiellaceae bacterium]|nr:fatty acyl-AMP ligase [Pseudohongiellaceae bacterium]